MSEWPDPRQLDPSTLPADAERELARLRFAADRIRTLAQVELRLLELAVGAADDDSARQYELRADSVWRDAMAVGGEHDPDHEFVNPEEPG
jgi:hypothetical protein